MRLSAVAKKGISISFTFRNTKSCTQDQEEYDFVLPPLVKCCLDYLVKNDGINTEGIFRISGSMTDIEGIAKRYERGKIVPLDSLQNIHTVAGLLKHYIRNRRGGLIPTSMRQLALAAGNIVNEDTRVLCISKAMRLLPPNNKLTMSKICQYLYEVQSNEEVNKMNVYNLSLIFSSTFLPADSSDLEHAYTQTAYAHAFTETLIKHQQQIFADPEDSEWCFTSCNEVKVYDELLRDYSENKDSKTIKRRKSKRENSNELQKMALINSNTKRLSSSVGETEKQPPSPGSSSPRDSATENVYLDEIVADKICRREEVELLSQCLMLGEPELFMQHLERISKGDIHSKDTIQKAAIKMCRHSHRRKSSV